MRYSLLLLCPCSCRADMSGWLFLFDGANLNERLLFVPLNLCGFCKQYWFWARRTLSNLYWQPRVSFKCILLQIMNREALTGTLRVSAECLLIIHCFCVPFEQVEHTCSHFTGVENSFAACFNTHCTYTQPHKWPHMLLYLIHHALFTCSSTLANCSAVPCDVL